VNGTVVFGFLARLSSEKALPLFLAAAASVARQLPLARFMVVGAAQHAAAERALAYLLTQYGFGDRVRLVVAMPIPIERGFVRGWMWCVLSRGCSVGGGQSRGGVYLCGIERVAARSLRLRPPTYTVCGRAAPI
jgi:glycosyltransferase involved in cell wall biosynthesis